MFLNLSNIQSLITIVIIEIATELAAFVLFLWKYVPTCAMYYFIIKLIDILFIETRTENAVICKNRDLVIPTTLQATKSHARARKIMGTWEKKSPAPEAIKYRKKLK